MAKNLTESAKVLAAQMAKVTAVNDDIRKQLEPLKQINVGRTGTVHTWKINTIQYKDNTWYLVVDFIIGPPKLFMCYDLAIVKNPIDHNAKIQNIINEFESPQSSLLQLTDGFVDRVKAIHATYETQANLFGIYDFPAEVAKYENKVKTDTKQITFAIPFDAVVHIGEMIQADAPLIPMSALVLSPKISSYL